MAAGAVARDVAAVQGTDSEGWGHISGTILFHFLRLLNAGQGEIPYQLCAVRAKGPMLAHAQTKPNT